MDPLHDPSPEQPQKDAMMVEVEKRSQDYDQISPSVFLSCDEQDILKQFGFHGSTPGVSQLSPDEQSWMSHDRYQKKPRRFHRRKIDEGKENHLSCKATDSALGNEDDVPLYLRFLKTVSSTQEIGLSLETNCRGVSAVPGKRQRASNSQSLKMPSASHAYSVAPFKRTPPEQREELNKEHLVVPKPCMLPHDMSCLFVEICNDDYVDDVRAAALRRLLAWWSGAMETETLLGISKASRIESSTPSMPPLHRRLIVLIAENASVLEESLLWWTLRPYAEHALILPIFGICPIGDTGECCSSRAPTSKEVPNVKGPQERKRTTSQIICKDNLSRKVLLAVKHNEPKRQFRSSLASVRVAALHHLCHSFAVNVSNSYALCYSKVCWDALQTLGIPTHHMKRTLEDCTRCIVKASTSASKNFHNKSQNHGTAVGFGLWLEATTATPQYRCDGSSVDEQRELIFSYLCSWNGLAQALATSTRRPELVLRVLTLLNSTISSRVLSMRICYALVRPVSTQGLCFACAISRGMRLFASQSPLVLLPTGAEEGFRKNFFNFLSVFFTPSVFRTAVDVVRSSSSDYIKGYSCSTLGYLQFEVSCWMRQYVYASLIVDLRPIISYQATKDNSGVAPRGCVLRALQCSCTPRQHEKVLFSENGLKKCRHHAELLYYFINRQINSQTQQVISTHCKYKCLEG